MRNVVRVLRGAGPVLALALGACAPHEDEKSATEAVTYYEVDELPVEARGRSIRVHGVVAPGTVVVRGGGSTMEVRFELERADTRIAVEHVGLPPEAFDEGADLVVEGVLADDGTRIVSKQLLVRARRSW